MAAFNIKRITKFFNKYHKILKECSELLYYNQLKERRHGVVAGCGGDVVRKEERYKEKEETKKNPWKEERGRNRKDIFRNTHADPHILRGINTVRGKERERCPRSKTVLSWPLFGSCY